MNQVQSLIESLRQAVDESSYTQRDLEKITGLKQPAIARLFNGSSIPRLDTYLKVALAIGYKVVLVKED